MADRIGLYTSPFTIRNQEIEKLDQAIKQASRDESSDQASISTIKILDRRRSWKYRAHSSDYPLHNIPRGGSRISGRGEHNHMRVRKILATPPKVVPPRPLIAAVA